MKNYSSSKNGEKIDSNNYRVIHKLPPGDSPYVRAKYAQVCYELTSI